VVEFDPQMIHSQIRQVNRRSSLRHRFIVIVALAIQGILISGTRAEEPWFEEISPENSGLDFRFDNGSRGQFDLPEIMAGGFAVADFDADGLPDLFFCQGGPIEKRPEQGTGTDQAPRPHQAADDPPCVWYRNLGDLKFRKMDTGQAGPSYAMGAWPADFDGDGLTDLFVTGWRGWSILRNLGGWKFEDRTASLGHTIPEWSTAAVWFDFDRDGNLDLCVGGYLKYDPARAPYCAAPDGRRDYCGPEDFEPVANRLFRGDGKGRFVDVSGKLGETRSHGRTLGAIASDFDADGDLDLFIANDGTACELLVNQGGESGFRDEAISSGVAFDGSGQALAGMGVAVIRSGDANDLLVTNFFGRGTVRFGRGKGTTFRDLSAESGIRQATSTVNGFGIAVADFDGDGIDEIIQANGHVLSRERLGTPFAMPPVLLRKLESEGYRAVDRRIFPVADRPMAGRGLLVADFDGDTKPDVLIARLDGPPVLLRNVTPRGQRRAQHARGAGGSYLSGIDLTRKSPGTR
jgi:hypothetical protein